MSDQGTSSRHKSSSVFNDVHLDGDFCDAVIKVEDVEFQIHKVILCKCSQYFRALFRRWSAQDKKVFDVSGLSPDIMKLIIEFAYTSHVSVTEDNVQELLLAADQFNITDIVDPCCVFLEEQLCPENCIGIWQFTNCNKGLQHKAYSVIMEHFEDVVSCEEFLQLSVQELASILDRDDVNVRKERTVFDAILRWITHEREERQGHIAVLLSKVRLALMGAEYIRINVMSNELVVNSTECMSMLRDAFQTIDRMVTDRLSALSNTVARPRLPNAILLAIGGRSADNLTNTIEAYDVRADRWIRVTNSLEHPFAYHGTAFLNGCVYCVGGTDDVEHFNSVFRFDLSTNTWHEAAPMYCRRSSVSVTVLDGWIYALGGHNGHTYFNTVECYRPETNQWSVIAPMQARRSRASCTSLHSKVYICGGFNGNEHLQTCECYSPETDQWTMIASMGTRRSALGVIAFADHVYAVGGLDGNSHLRSAEAYNPQTNSWRAVSSMLAPCSSFGIEVINDQLFAVGGYKCQVSSSNVEFYDATTDKWSEARHMDISRHVLSCCAVSKIPNMSRYAVPRDTLPFLKLEDECAEAGESSV